MLAVGLDPGELPGCRVGTVEDLLGALATLADGQTDVVLLSLDLPDAQGADAVRAVRERSPSVPVIALARDEEDGARAVRAGARDALPADGDPSLVRRAIRYATELARLEAELEWIRTIDEVTGLPNTRGLELIGEHHLRLADRSHTPVELVLIRFDAPTGIEQLDTAEPGAAVTETAEVLRGLVR
ncbi:MAG TPA: response regulator, partial [Actinomycetota bacterium]|nr:response regulator [Actinomycetota bacterium]